MSVELRLMELERTVKRLDGHDLFIGALVILSHIAVGAAIVVWHTEIGRVLRHLLAVARDQ